MTTILRLWACPALPLKDRWTLLGAMTLFDLVSTQQ